MIPAGHPMDRMPVHSGVRFLNAAGIDLQTRQAARRAGQLAPPIAGDPNLPPSRWGVARISTGSSGGGAFFTTPVSYGRSIEHVVLHTKRIFNSQTSRPLNLWSVSIFLDILVRAWSDVGLGVAVAK